MISANAVDVTTVLEVGTPITVAVLAAFGFVVRLMIQAAFAQRPAEGDDADGRDERVADLKKQVQRSEDRIEELERALEREREERAEDNRRHAREVADLNRQLQEVLRDLASTRERYRPTTNEGTS